MKRNQVKFTEQYLKKLSHARPIDKHGNPTDRKYFADPETTGLYFYVRCLAGGGLTCKWIFRMQPSQRIQKPLKTVLGTYPDMKYIEARLKALSILSQLYEGGDLDAIKQNVAIDASKQKFITLSEAATLWLEHALDIGHYKQPLYAKRELARIQKNLLRSIGNIPIAKLTFEDICGALKPCWKKEATRDKILGTLRNVLIFACHKHWAPSTILECTNLDRMKLELGDFVSSDRCYPALPVDKIPAFMFSLREHKGIQFRTLEFQILLCLRSSNARLLRWDQVRNLESDNPYIAFRKEELKVIKNGDFCIPLSTRAIEILHEMLLFRRHYLPKEKQFVFPSLRRFACPISSNTQEKTLHTMHNQELEQGREGWIDPIASEDAGEPVRITAHGTARATFRTWAAHNPTYREKPLELCLHHREKSDVKERYDRFDYFDERRKILNDWSEYCCSFVK